MIRQIAGERLNIGSVLDVGPGLLLSEAVLLRATTIRFPSPMS